MIHNFSIKLSRKNCRKLKEILEITNFDKNESIFKEIKEISETYRYNDQNFSEIFKTCENPKKKILTYLNFIDDFYGNTFFSDKEDFDVLESLVLYYIDNDLTPIKIYFSIDSRNFFSLKKFSRYFSNKYENLKYNFVTVSSKKLQESKENIYLIPLKRDFKYIKLEYIDINHRSSIFYNFISSNLPIINKELTRNKSVKFDFFPFNYYNSGICEYSIGYRLNLIPVSVIESSDDINLLYYLYHLCFKINFNIFDDEIFHYIKLDDIHSKKSKSIANLLGLYINNPGIF